MNPPAKALVCPPPTTGSPSPFQGCTEAVQGLYANQTRFSGLRRALSKAALSFLRRGAIVATAQDWQETPWPDAI